MGTIVTKPAHRQCYFGVCKALDLSPAHTQYNCFCFHTANALTSNMIFYCISTKTNHIQFLNVPGNGHNNIII